jgi:Ca-activated chloride channel family protein
MEQTLMDGFHFLRPAWFLALLPLAVLLILLWRRRRAGRAWQKVVDPGLLPYLLISDEKKRIPLGIAAVALGGLLAIVTLAGPTWTKLQQPVFRRDTGLVVLLDLSRSMNAADLRPSRLQLAKFKLRDILARRKEGETALVVYAADPFVVTPLTGDTDTITRQLSSLTTDIMPAQGSRADRAITKAQALLRQAGAVRGDVLLITDGVDNAPPAPLRAAVANLAGAGYRLSVLGVGTADGAPIPEADGGFFKDAGGAIVVAKLNEDGLERLAAAGSGIYRRLAVDDSDTDALTRTFDNGWGTGRSRRVAGMKSDQWREEGPWLLLPLLPLAALAFRRGCLLLLFVAVLLPTPRNAYAYDWDALWQSPDQRGAQALAEQHPQQAAKLFQDPAWRAAAAYRGGDYQAAVNDLDKLHSAAADYNRGNALAHMGKLSQAVAAYNDALKRDPGFKDAAYNRDLVKKWLQSSQNRSAGDGHQHAGQQQRGQSSPSQSGRSDKQQQGGQSTARSPSDKQRSSGQQAPGDKGDNGAGKTPMAQSRGDAKGKQDRQSTQQAQRDRSGDHNTQTAMNDALARPDASADGTPPRDESEQAAAQWLRRIPDDPGGLWRRKFLYQYKREHTAQQSEAKPW